MASLGEEDETPGLKGAAIDVFAGSVVEDVVGHSVDKQERLAKVFDFPGTVQLGRHADDSADDGRKFTGLDNDGAAKAVTNENHVGGTDPLEE